MFRNAQLLKKVSQSLSLGMKKRHDLGKVLEGRHLLALLFELMTLIVKHMSVYH